MRVGLGIFRDGQVQSVMGWSKSNCKGWLNLVLLNAGNAEGERDFVWDGSKLLGNGKLWSVRILVRSQLAKRGRVRSR